MGQFMAKILDFFSVCCQRQKKDKKKKKKKHREPISTQKVTIKSNWEELDEKESLTPSQIPDDNLTREVNLESDKRLTNEIEFNTKILAKENYIVVKDNFIGKGGSGRVYKIEHKITREVMAAKVIKLVKKEKSSKTRFLLFKNEIFIMRRNIHRNIIQLKDHFICNKSLSFIIMEYADGGNLEDKLRTSEKPFPEEIAKDYFVQISNAIHYLHSKGIIHGDLKLDNVLLFNIRGKEVAKVTDFGCSQIVFRKEIGIVMLSKAVGTVAYMSPEQIALYISTTLKRPDLLKKGCKRYNGLKADMWALGVCLFKLVTQKKPFICTDRRDANDVFRMYNSQKSFQLTKTIFQQLSSECIDLMKSLLEFDAYKRIDIQIVYTINWVVKCKEHDPTGQNQ